MCASIKNKPEAAKGWDSGLVPGALGDACPQMPTHLNIVFCFPSQPPLSAFRAPLPIIGSFCLSHHHPNQAILLRKKFPAVCRSLHLVLLVSLMSSSAPQTLSFMDPQVCQAKNLQCSVPPGYLTLRAFPHAIPSSWNASLGPISRLPREILLLLSALSPSTTAQILWCSLITW